MTMVDDYNENFIRRIVYNTLSILSLSRLAKRYRHDNNKIYAKDRGWEEDNRFHPDESSE